MSFLKNIFNFSSTGIFRIKMKKKLYLIEILKKYPNHHWSKIYIFVEIVVEFF
jgi:hypothetical protein